MSIDASAVARVLGIETSYENMREGAILYLPQRLAVIGQGSTNSVYSSTKFTAQSAGDVGSKVGYGSPLHLALMQLLPGNGDGVGTIPVDVYPLQQLGGATPSTGDITPAGTQTQTGSYRVKVGGVLSQPFVIPAGATVSYILGAMLVAMQAVLEMPVDVVPAYGTVTSAPGTNTGNGTLTALSVTGTPRPGNYKLTAKTAVTNGGVFQLTDPDGLIVSSAVTMTPGAGGVSVINVGGLQFSLTDGTTDFAVADSFTITVPATKLNLTSKWKGDSANSIKLSIIGDLHGVTFAFTLMANGAGNPSVSPALAQFGNVWETMVLNCLNISDTTALDAIQTFGEGRWGDTVRKPFVAFTGTAHAAVVDATAVSSTRRTDRVNGQLVSPGSEDLPLVIAARQLARIAKIANNNPPRDYGAQKATGLTPGPDGSQWDYPLRDQAIKLGSSTVEVRDGVVCLSDIVTFYRPTGEEPPAYRCVVDIVKLQQIVYNLSLIFEAEEWDGAPLIPDTQPTVNEAARKPRDVIAAANAMLDKLGLAAIISAPDVAKKKTTCTITGPKRWRLVVKPALSGNSNIRETALGFGFYSAT
jgi:phage tail sheath gpL-like